MSEPQKYRVGVVGRSSAGQFLLERLSFLPECQTVLFQPPESAPNPSAQTLGCLVVADWEIFLSGSGLNAVLFLDGETLSPRQVEEVFQAALAVGLLPPLALEPSEWKELMKEGNREWRILNPHHDDPDFRAAMVSLQSGELGTIEAIKRVSWVGELLVRKGALASVSDAWLSRLLWEDIDQLLHLAGEPPVSVYTADLTETPASYCVIFQFANGWIGHLERRRGSGMPLEIGWTIGSGIGGYANGHQHIKTAEGEIYDVPVEISPRPSDSLSSPLDAIASTTHGPTAARHVSHILEVLKAIKQSAQAKQVVLLDWPESPACSAFVE